ncbi:hypothetical protein [Enterovibrio coralii]|uniref:Uncharacterized protein n=1 Tax=Enterovibrio coralii TaxID=294935 RepID=A0A135I8T6_9GAMM|nr:hypothetical protein [Enterovibrio coralii]KXF81860.1 hypothetical protein ATN88_20420 [Enterovibrio coralii]
MIQESLEAEMMMDTAPADAALPEPPKVEMKARSNAETFERFSRAPEHDVEVLSEAEIHSKIEAKLKFIQILIDNDETEMAKQQLRILLRTYPQAKEELTAEMCELMKK